MRTQSSNSRETTRTDFHETLSETQFAYVNRNSFFIIKVKIENIRHTHAIYMHGTRAIVGVLFIYIYTSTRDFVHANEFCPE